MSWGMVAVAGASLVGGAMGASASKSAAKDQANAAREAAAQEREMFDKQIELQAPWREAGGLGLNRLAYELGLSPGGTFTPGLEVARSGTTSQPVTSETRDQILARLSPQYLTQVQQATPQTGGAEEGLGNFGGGPAVPLDSRLDEVALNAAVDAELAKQQQAATAKQTATNTLAASNAAKDPQYGSLLRNFSMQDFEADPGYGFRLSEGQKALDRAAAAGGRFNSGRAMKDITRFGQGMASDEYGRAYDRYRLNQGDRYNKLASVAGIGQTATNQTAQAAGAYGSAAGGYAIGAGNASAAGRVGAANAWSGAAGQVGSMYQQNQLMSMLRQPSSGWSNPGGWAGTSLGNHFLGNGTGGD